MSTKRARSTADEPSAKIQKKKSKTKAEQKEGVLWLAAFSIKTKRYHPEYVFPTTLQVPVTSDGGDSNDGASLLALVKLTTSKNGPSAECGTAFNMYQPMKGELIHIPSMKDRVKLPDKHVLLPLAKFNTAAETLQVQYGKVSKERFGELVTAAREWAENALSLSTQKKVLEAKHRDWKRAIQAANELLE